MTSQEERLLIQAPRDGVYYPRRGLTMVILAIVGEESLEVLGPPPLTARTLPRFDEDGRNLWIDVTRWCYTPAELNPAAYRQLQCLLWFYRGGLTYSPEQTIALRGGGEAPMDVIWAINEWLRWIGYDAPDSLEAIYKLLGNGDPSDAELKGVLPPAVAYLPKGLTPQLLRAFLAPNESGTATLVPPWPNA